MHESGTIGPRLRALVLFTPKHWVSVIQDYLSTKLFVHLVIHIVHDFFLDFCNKALRAVIDTIAAMRPNHQQGQAVKKQHLCTAPARFASTSQATPQVRWHFTTRREYQQGACQLAKQTRNTNQESRVTENSVRPASP
jgi:hypothetical protein